MSAQIEVSADTTEITDKSGATIRTIYNNKSATFTSTSALLSPALLNANSGSEIKNASADAPIVMPAIRVVAAGETLDVKDIAADATVHVMGIYSNGANGAVLVQSTAASLENGEFGYDSSAKTVTVPGATEQTAGGDTLTGPTQYLVKYDRDVESGMMMENVSDQFPATVHLTLYAAIMDPCQDYYKAAYIYIPSFQPDPNVTISFDKDNQEVDFNGNINVDLCSDQKVLYYIYLPDEQAVATGVTA